MRNNQWRWEPCPECQFGFPEYVGKKGKYHQFVCGDESCEAFYQVEEGKGAYDLRQGMMLYEDSIYFEKCDGCKNIKPVKVINLRFTCVDCLQT